MSQFIKDSLISLIGTHTQCEIDRDFMPILFKKVYKMLNIISFRLMKRQSKRNQMLEEYILYDFI